MKHTGRPAPTCPRDPLHSPATNWLAAVGFGLALCVALPLRAQSYALDVQPANQLVFNAEARKTVTITFRVTNRGRDGRFEAEIGVPDGWRLVSGDAPFRLAEGQASIRAVNLEVPEETLAGAYTVSYLVQDQEQPDNRRTTKVTVRVRGASNGGNGDGHRTESLLLEVRVNGQPLRGIIRAERLTDGRMALPADAWAAARLRPAGQELTLVGGQRGYALEAVPGLDYQLDRANLTLNVKVPAAAFDETVLNVGSTSVPPTPSPLGLYLNYSLLASHADNSTDTYGALLEGVAFGGWGSLVAGAAIQGGGSANTSVRADTYWRKDLPGRMETVVVGDTIGTGGAWSRPVRFGGVRYARDFSLAPGFITYPVPSISGSAALPSTVDVLINNQNSVRSKVQPGPFELTNVPVFTGAGEMQLVVRDLLGRETVINQSYYVAPQLLVPGLSDFSFEAGALRENYGTSSNDYGSVFGAGTYRLGLTDALTGEVRAEVQRDRGAAGAGIAALIDKLAVVGLAAGYSVADGEHGGHYLAAGQRTTPQGGASFAWSHFDHGYTQFAALPGEKRPRDQYLASGNVVVGRGISAGLSYTRQTVWNGDSFTLVGAGLGIPLAGNMYLNAFASKQLEAGNGWSAGVNLTIPLEHGRTVSAGSNRDTSGRVTDAVNVSQALPAGPGWGWHVTASDSESQRLQAGAALNTEYAQIVGEANAGKYGNAVRIGTNGSVGWMSGLPFAARFIDQGSFAVVNVGGFDQVPVYLSNQLVAKTNGNGLALVTGLVPYQQNQLTVNPAELPLDVEIRGVKETVVPYARSGVFVDFPVRRSRNALVVLHQPDGAPVPAGARASMPPDGREFIVGKRGEVYLMDLQNDNHVAVQWKGGACTVDIRLDPAGPGEARLGPLACGGAP